MSFVCRTLAFVERRETKEIVAGAFARPKYELEFVDNLNEGIPITNHSDLFVVESQFLNDERVATIKHHLPTVIVDAECIRVMQRPVTYGGEGSTIQESEKIRIAAEKLLRKSYFNWLVDALEYTS